MWRSRSPGPSGRLASICSSSSSVMLMQTLLRFSMTASTAQFDMGRPAGLAAHPHFIMVGRLGSATLLSQCHSRLATMSFYDKLKFDANGLIPAIIQEQKTGRVLMMAG